MTLSILYKDLKLRNNELKKQFLDFALVDSPLPENQDKLRAYRVLIHAEMEHYFENCVKGVINFASQEYITNKKILPVLKYLMLYSSNKFQSDQYLSIDARVLAIMQSFNDKIKNNHGIKQANIIQLVVPLGVTQVYLDNSWLATMDSFGSKRGEVAHNSYSVCRIIDKQVEIDEIENVLTGFKKLDSRLQQLKGGNTRSPFLKIFFRNEFS